MSEALNINKQPIFGSLPHIILSGALKQKISCESQRYSLTEVQGAMFSVTTSVRRLFVRKVAEHQCSLAAFPCSVFVLCESAPWCCWDQMKPFLMCIMHGVLVTLCDHTHLRCKRHESPRQLFFP